MKALHMYQYTVIQWLFFFYFYCFCGWCFESAYVSIKNRKWTNRGFMRGPFLPLYGSGAIMMLVVSMPFQDHLLLVYVAGCVGATVLEYITGVTMEALFQVRYWDYSKNKFNFQGHICLGTSLSWGFLTILMTEVVHKPIETLILSIPSEILTGVTYVLTIVIAADFALAFKAALDLRDVLVRMEKAKEELVHIQERLNAIVEAADEEWSSYREEWTENVSTRMEDLRESVEANLDRIKTFAQSKQTEYFAEVKEELAELRKRYSRNVEERRRLSSLRDFFQQEIIRSNPTLRSERHEEALAEVKEKLERGGANE
ncbi:MAG: hypothetical protein NC417_03665 [Candidatus Gastranaerophilales bacterium]|nr:hypothetical protein [Candidatus Gastranaerophilales bacterium]